MKATPMKNIEVLHRGADNAIPYVAHNLFTAKLPLVRVRVGPLVTDIGEIESIVKHYGYDIPVSKSNIPLRLATAIKP